MPATIVLVHGAWHGAWCWDRVVEGLAARGVDVVAVDLPGHGASRQPLGDLHGDAAVVGRALDALDGPAVVCGHSYGGAVISEGAAGHPNVRHLVYLAALMPDAGESCSTSIPAASRWRAGPVTELGPAMQFSDDGATVNVDPVARTRDLLRRLHRRRRRLGHRATRAASRDRAPAADSRRRVANGAVDLRGVRRRPGDRAVDPARVRRRGPPTPSSGPRATHRSSRSRISWWSCSPGSRPNDRPRTPQPRVLGCRRRRLPGRARRRPRAASEGVGRVAHTGGRAPGARRHQPGSTSSSTAAARRSGRSRSPGTAHARSGSTSRPGNSATPPPPTTRKAIAVDAGVRER